MEGVRGVSLPRQNLRVRQTAWMSLRPFASLGVKLLGLYAVLGALPSIGALAIPFRSYAGSTSPFALDPRLVMFFNILPGVIQMIVGIGLWAFSDGIAHSMVKDEGNAPTPSSNGWSEIVFSAVGALVLVDFATKLAQFTANVWSMSRTGSLLRPEDAHIGTPDLLPILVRGALGLWLLLGARGIVRGVANVRNVGRDAQD